MRKNKVNYLQNFYNQPEDWQFWFLGFMAADGWVSRTSNEVSILQQANRQHWIEDIIFRLGLTSLYYRKQTNAYITRLSCKDFKEMLYNFGIGSNKTQDLLFPKNLTADQTRWFISGFLDGDGCVCKIKESKSETKVININFTGLKSVLQEIANSYGGFSTICNYKTSYVKKLIFWGKRAIDFGNWLWSDNCFSYKKELFLQYKQEYLDSRKDIEEYRHLLGIILDSGLLKSKKNIWKLTLDGPKIKAFKAWRKTRHCKDTSITAYDFRAITPLLKEFILEHSLEA